MEIILYKLGSIPWPDYRKSTLARGYVTADGVRNGPYHGILNRCRHYITVRKTLCSMQKHGKTKTGKYLILESDCPRIAIHILILIRRLYNHPLSRRIYGSSAEKQTMWAGPLP